MRLNAMVGAAVAWFVEVAIMRKALVFPAGALLLLATAGGCGSADRPATSGSIVTDEAALATQPAPPPPGEPGMPNAACEPRSNRECTIPYVDEDGQLQCPVQIQICSADGSRWLECGMYVYDETHTPQPRQSGQGVPAGAGAGMTAVPVFLNDAWKQPYW